MVWYPYSTSSCVDPDFRPRHVNPVTSTSSRTHASSPCITSIKWWSCDIAIPIHAKSSVVLSRACITLVRTLMLIIIAHSPSTNGSISYFVDGLMFSRCVISLLVTVRVLLTSVFFFSFLLILILLVALFLLLLLNLPHMHHSITLFLLITFILKFPVSLHYTLVLLYVFFPVSLL